MQYTAVGPSLARESLLSWAPRPGTPRARLRRQVHRQVLYQSRLFPALPEPLGRCSSTFARTAHRLGISHAAYMYM